MICLQILQSCLGYVFSELPAGCPDNEILLKSSRLCAVRGERPSCQLARW
jgi:hypothetical protein